MKFFSTPGWIYVSCAAQRLLTVYENHGLLDRAGISPLVIYVGLCSRESVPDMCCTLLGPPYNDLKALSWKCDGEAVYHCIRRFDEPS